MENGFLRVDVTKLAQTDALTGRLGERLAWILKYSYIPASAGSSLYYLFKVRLKDFNFFSEFLLEYYFVSI